MNLLKSTVCFTFFLLRRCIRAVVVVAVVNVVCFFGIETVVPCAWCVLRLNCGKANDCGKLNNLLIPWNRELLLLLFISSIFRLMLRFFFAASFALNYRNSKLVHINKYQRTYHAMQSTNTFNN